MIYGIGWCFHIAFWEPHFAADYASMDEWKKATHRVGGEAAPAHRSSRTRSRASRAASRWCPRCANTIGPGIFLRADYTIGGVDGYLPVRNMIYQGQTLWVTLKYGPDMWIPSSVMPQLPGKLFYIKPLAGPLEPEVN